jgi:hypothetical protein
VIKKATPSFGVGKVLIITIKVRRSQPTRWCHHPMGWTRHGMPGLYRY